MSCHTTVIYSFFVNDTATTEIYTLSLHDALPISKTLHHRSCGQSEKWRESFLGTTGSSRRPCRSLPHLLEMLPRRQPASGAPAERCQQWSSTAHCSHCECAGPRRPDGANTRGQDFHR